MKSISVITTTRADYGILTPLVRELANESSVNLELLVTGTHFSRQHGNTYKELGFAHVSHFMDLDLEETNYDVHDVFSRMLRRVRQYLLNHKPDCVIILGDRFEILSAALSTFFLRIPIVHIHGGENTLGAQDEAFRHSITKLSNLHFTANSEFRRRVIQLGEDPETVYDVGALGLDNISGINFPNSLKLKQSLGLSPEDEFVLLSYHPETNSKVPPGLLAERICNVLLSCLISGEKIVAIGPNMDPGFQEILKVLDTFKFKENFIFHANLPSKIYLSAMKYCNFMIGNSSSAIIESTYLGAWAIDIGDRQSGRPIDKNIIHCSNEEKEIIKSVKQAINVCKNQLQPKLNYVYGRAGSAKLITKILVRTDFRNLKSKTFYDINFPNL
jgi:GDP/UDP-N,N'-diacetylbacillosamine 2-epimerase (hydrolysing)